MGFFERMPPRKLALCIGASAGALFVLAMSWWGMYRLGRRAAEPPASEPAATVRELERRDATTGGAPSTTTPSITPLYRLGVWQGKVAVFKWPAESPDEVFDVNVAALPLEEQMRLSEGIDVYDDVTLAGYLEDFTS